MSSRPRRPTLYPLLALVVAACGGDDDVGDESASQTSIGAVCEDAPTEPEAAFALAQAYCGELYKSHYPLQEAYGTFD